MKHGGVSGCKVIRVGDKVHKIGSFHHKGRELVEGMELQNNSHINPFKTVKIEPKREGDNLILIMDYIDLESGYTLKDSEKDNFTKVLHQYFENRFKESKKSFWFHQKVREKVAEIYTNLSAKRLDDLVYLTDLILDRLKHSLLQYPMGDCHGDFGFANMFVSETDCYLIDFTKRFIDSPLIDLATMARATDMAFGVRTQYHIDLVNDLLKKYEEHSEQIKLLRLLEIVSWIPHIVDKEQRDGMVKKALELT